MKSANVTEVKIYVAVCPHPFCGHVNTLHENPNGKEITCFECGNGFTGRRM